MYVQSVSPGYFSVDFSSGNNYYSRVQKKQGEGALPQDLDEWLRKQGVWFQLRHGMAGTLCAYRRMQRLTIIGVKLGIMMIVLLFAVIVANDLYLKSPGYSDSVNARLAFALNLPEDTRAFRALGVSRQALSIGNVRIEGRASSFFESLNVVGVSGKRPLLASALRSWFPTDIQISRMKVHLRTSYASESDARKAFASILGDAWLQHMSIAKLSLAWGQDGNAGRIEGAVCECTRDGDQWIVRLKGGIFFYGPLQACHLVQATVTISDDQGLVLNNLTIRTNDKSPAEIRISGRVSGSENPLFDGRVAVRNLNLSDYCAPSLAWMFDSSLQGEGTIHGVLKNPYGMDIALDCLPTDGTSAKLHSVLPVLQLLSLYEPKFRQLSSSHVALRLSYNGEAGVWKADRLKFETADFPSLVLEATDISCRRMTDGEWFDLPFSPRHMLDAKPRRQAEGSQTAFAVAMSGDKKADSTADNVLDVTRETRIIEGRVTISFPRSVLPEHWSGDVEDVLVLDEQEDRYRLNVSLNRIAREISMDEADKIQTLLFRQPKQEKE